MKYIEFVDFFTKKFVLIRKDVIQVVEDESKPEEKLTKVKIILDDGSIEYTSSEYKWIREELLADD